MGIYREGFKGKSTWHEIWEIEIVFRIDLIHTFKGLYNRIIYLNFKTNY